MRTLIRLLVFAAGGTLGGFLVLLFLSRVTPNGLTLIVTALGVNLPFPASLLAGTALGAIAWLGFTLGHAHWTYLAHRPGHTPSRMPVAVALIALYMILGVVLGILNTLSQTTTLPPWIATILLLVALPLGVPLGYGYLSGFGERPPAMFTAWVGIIGGPLTGFWLAFVAGITSVFYPPPPPSPTVHLFLGPLGNAVIGMIALTAFGLGIGIVTGCAEGIGLWLCPPAPTTARRGGVVPPAA